MSPPTQIPFIPKKKQSKKPDIEEDLRDNQQLSDLIDSDIEDTESTSTSGRSTGVSGKKRRRQQEDDEDEEMVDNFSLVSTDADPEEKRKLRKVIIDNRLGLVNYNPQYPRMKTHSLVRLDASNEKITFAFGIPNRAMPALCAATIVFCKAPDIRHLLKTDPKMLTRMKEAFKELLTSLK